MSLYATQFNGKNKKSKKKKKPRKYDMFKPDWGRLNEYNNVGQLANHLDRNKLKSLSHTFF